MTLDERGPIRGVRPFPCRIQRVNRTHSWRGRQSLDAHRSLLMARSGLITLLIVAGVLAVSPAAAQFPNIFDTIFGNPPRPPGNVPGLPPGPPPSEPQYIPPPGGLPPGPPPGRPLYSRGSHGGVQSEQLPPPPGAVSAPPGARVAPPNRRPQDVQPGAQPGQGQAGGPVPGAMAALPPNDETVLEPSPSKIANPTAVFSGLDKITGRIISFDVAINETVRFGALEVTPRACYTRPPTEPPNTDGFVDVDELTLQGELRRIFTGWMFAASPGLNAVEHPIYDVWLTGCKGGAQPALTAETAPEVVPQPRRPPRRRATQ